VRREDIPARLRVARASDCQRIPLAALKSMKPADVAPRLLAADEFRRRARVPHLDGDLMSYRLSQASEVLTTADPKRAAQLLAKAGITSYQLRDGTTVPTATEHDIRAAVAIGQRDRSTGRPGDDEGFRQHLIGRAAALGCKPAIPASWAPGAGAAASQAAGKSAAVSGRLAKSAAPRERSVTVPTPALDLMGASRSLPDGMTTLIRHGLLHQAARELGQVAAVQADLNGAGHLAKAEQFKRKAMVASDPADRRGYEELAKAELVKAGAA
jgi:hypothetical protein